MTRVRSRMAIVLAVVVAVFGAAQLYGAVTYTKLYSFTVGADGYDPGAPLVEGPDGFFYGVTQNGGGTIPDACGTAFKLSPEGAFTLLHTFTADLCVPTGLMLASDGVFYGTTSQSVSGGGTVFSMTTDGTAVGTAVVQLHEFTSPEGAAPFYPLIEGSDGLLYGTTFAGGANDLGTVFRIDTDGNNLAFLHHFGENADAGLFPSSGLLLGDDGAFYGTTLMGGNPSAGDPGGTVFKMTVAGSVGTVTYPVSFSVGGADGHAPFGGLVEPVAGTFYGTTTGDLSAWFSGTAVNKGTVFKLDSSGLETLHTFSVDPADLDGAKPYGRLLLADDGNLYGTTLQGGTLSGLGGTVFRYPLVSPGPLEILHVFDGSVAGDTGDRPVAGLTQGTDGKLYGTTSGLTLIDFPSDPGTFFSIELDPVDPGEPGVTLTIAPPSVQGGKDATGTVTIPDPAPAGGLVVTLASDTPSVATVPATVTIPAGATSKGFKIPTVPVGEDTVVEVSASVGGPAATATFVVTPPTLSKLALKPPSVVGGLTSTGTITLHGAAPVGGLAVTVLSDNAVAQVSSPVVVPAGETSVDFVITTSATGVSTAAEISASYGGVTKAKTLTVTPVALAKITLAPKEVTGGVATTATITLNGPAPTGGLLVTITSDKPGAAESTSVLVPDGATTADTTITTFVVATKSNVKLTAVGGGVSKAANLSVK